MNNKLSLAFILTPLLLAIWLAGCGESDTDDPVDQSMKGEFMLAKAVGLEQTQTRGPNPDDPTITKYIPHTYEYPELTGRFILGETSFYLYVSLPLKPLHLTGSYEVLPKRIGPYENLSNIDLHAIDDVKGWDATTRVQYEWCGDTLIFKDFFVTAEIMYWNFHWKRISS